MVFSNTQISIYWKYYDNIYYKNNSNIKFVDDLFNI